MKYSQSSIPYQYHFRSLSISIIDRITNLHALSIFFMSGLILAFASRGQYAEALKTALDDSPTRAKDETCKVRTENIYERKSSSIEYLQQKTN